MQDYSGTIPHKKICLAVFVPSCIILIIFYYSNDSLDYRFQLPTQEIFYAAEGNVSAGSNRSIQLPNTSIISTTTTTIIIKQSRTKTKPKSTYNPFNVTSRPDAKRSNRTRPDMSVVKQIEGANFLVSSSKCKIIDMDPFNKGAKKYFHPESYKPCRKLELLTYVTKMDNISILHIDNETAPSYSSKGVSCCYSNVSRPHMKDVGIEISTCKGFQYNVTIGHEPVLVKCVSSDNKKQVYENVHVSITPTEEVQRKMDVFDNATRGTSRENTSTTYAGSRPLSVLFVGIDSISRLNLIRSLPKTYKFLEDNEWVPLRGYNKMDDNTFPNLMAILTGFNQSYAYNVCNPKAVGKLDVCPMLWYDYRRLGYVTAYAEDESSINTFNYLKHGFRKPPTDYYLRPYVIASEKLKKVNKDGMTYCTGPETAGERIMNVAKDFAVTFKSYPNFGFFWMNSFSHNKLNTPSGMDRKVKNFLEDLTVEGVTNTSIIIFLSDHGLRFGDIRLTETGWLEERLPFVYLSFPKWFQETFPVEFNNFKANTNRLTCPYDLHMTLKHVLVLSGHNYSMTPGDACPLCKSLFDGAEEERSCEDAAITQHWCTCAGFKSTSLDKDLKRNVSSFVLDRLAETIRSSKGDESCAKYSISEVMDVRLSETLPYKNETYLLVRLRTRPEAIFEATLSFNGDITSRNFSLSGDISRLDSYKKSSECVSDSYLKKYCYCH